jgi:hypothetical protein
MTQIFSHLPLLSHIEQLKIYEDPDADFLFYNSDPSQWMELFRLFIALQGLRVSKTLVPLILPTLRGSPG